MGRLQDVQILLLAAVLRAMMLFLGVITAVVVLLERSIMFILWPTTFFYVKARPKPPTCTEDPKYGVHSLVRVNGLSLHCVANGKQGAPMMLLVHGFPESWWSWRYQLTEFADQYFVVAFDLRGYGESSKPNGKRNYKMDCVVQDIRELIKHFGYNSAVVVAHDWGAAISWEFTHQFPEMVNRLVIMDNPPNVVRWKAMIKATLSFTAWYNFFFQLPYLPELTLRAHDMLRLEEILTLSICGVPDKSKMSDDDIEMFKYAFSQDGAWTYPINYYRARWSYWAIVEMLKAMNQYRKKPWRILPKTLILWGSKDLPIPYKLAYECQTYCLESKVVIVPGASHWLQQHEPELVNKEIRDFLSS